VSAPVAKVTAKTTKKTQELAEEKDTPNLKKRRRKVTLPNVR
jgi:hypothetical protein